jgi:hypothetical protein
VSDLTRRATLGGLAGALIGCGVGQAVAPTLSFRVRPQPLAPGFQAGMNLAHLHRRGQGYGSAASRVQLLRLRSLGMTHGVLTPFGYLPSLTGTRIAYGSDLDPTLTDDDLVREMVHAREAGLQVVLKPHLWARAFGGGKHSRQDVRPDDWAGWFRAYTAFARHYGQVAERGGASWLVIGLEYLKATQENPGAWARVAQACRQDFGGKLTYAANWYAEVDAFQDWAAFDAIGVNAYYPLTQDADPPVEALVAAWQPHLAGLERLARRVERPVLFCETGLRAVAGSAARPWDHGLSGPADPALQGRGYEALLRSIAGRAWLQGVWWWKWFTDDPGEHDPYCPRDQPAEGVLAAWHS